MRLIDADAFAEKVLPECEHPEVLKKWLDEEPTADYPRMCGYRLEDLYRLGRACRITGVEERELRRFLTDLEYAADLLLAAEKNSIQQMVVETLKDNSPLYRAEVTVKLPGAGELIRKCREREKGGKQT